MLVEGALIIDYSRLRRGFLSGEPIGRKKYTKLLPPQKLFSPPGKVHSRDRKGAACGLIWLKKEIERERARLEQ